MLPARTYQCRLPENPLKKLTAAGYYWVTSTEKPMPYAPNKPLSDTEFFGVPSLAKSVENQHAGKPDWFVEWLAEKPGTTDFIVWFDAWAAIGLFATLQTQWRTGYEGVTGLDYTAVIAVISLNCQRKSEQMALLVDIQALEHGALTGINEQREQAANETTGKK